MPTYEYKCKICDDRFEIEQSISDDSLTVLDGCNVADDGGHQLKKVFSAVGISFKGEGFYRNDARSSSSSKKSSNGDADSTSSDSSSSDSSSSSSNGSSSDSSSSSTSSSSTSDAGSSPAKSTTSSSSSD